MSQESGQRLQAVEAPKDLALSGARKTAFANLLPDIGAWQDVEGIGSFFGRVPAIIGLRWQQIRRFADGEENMIARIILAFAICGAAWATTPASAQSGKMEAAPAIPLAPSPAPYDSTTGSTQTPPAKRASVIEGKSPETQAVDGMPQNAVAAEAKQTAPPKEIPAAEGKAPDSLPIENAPRNSPGAEGKSAENSESRFTFARMNDGYVRLDNRTGQVSFCSKRTVGWTCQLATEDRGVLENEIARLQEENVSLKKEFLARGLPLPGSIKSDPPVGQNERPSSLASDPNIERMKVIVENTWRRLVDMITALQKEVLKKS